MTLTISLPADAECKLKERASAAGQDVARFVEQLVVREIAGEMSPTQLNTIEDPDEQYTRGYATLPEDISEVSETLPHLMVDAGKWK